MANNTRCFQNVSLSFLILLIGILDLRPFFGESVEEDLKKAEGREKYINDLKAAQEKEAADAKAIEEAEANPTTPKEADDGEEGDQPPRTQKTPPGSPGTGGNRAS